jgi:hypothetical protein
MGTMRNRGVTRLAVGVLLLAATSTAWAYTYSQTDVLSGTGDVELTVGIWDPADSASPLYGTGYWGFEYEMYNVSLDPYITWLNIGGQGVEEWMTPANWTFYTPVPNDNFRWDADSGFELPPGQTLGGFGVKSNQYYTGPSWAYVEEGTDIHWAWGDTLGPTELIPEPCSLLLFGGGLVTLAASRKARRKRS